MLGRISLNPVGNAIVQDDNGLLLSGSSEWASAVADVALTSGSSFYKAVVHGHDEKTMNSGIGVAFDA